MHRYRPYSASASSSRATPTTRCQKCLKLGHYSYDCKATTQDRPYVSRPSRSQQLRDPKLLTKLTEATLPDDKKGVADSILKAKEEERETRKRRRDGSPSPSRARSRSSSVSSYSSYSSISSGRRSPSPPPRTSRAATDRRRSDSFSRSPDHERSVRRKFRASPGPSERGRRLSPTDFSRRTRSASKPRRVVVPPKRKSGSPEPMKESYDSGAPARRSSLVPVPAPAPVPAAPARGRSPSPFTRRKLMTEAMHRGG